MLSVNFRLFLALAIICGIAVRANAQTGSVMAGQTAGIQVIHPNNLSFYCDPQPPHECSQVDVDGDGTSDFTLFFEGGGAYSISLKSLFPNTWQLLGDGNPAQFAASVPRGGLISVTSAGSWIATGTMQYDTGYNGIPRNTGFWRSDTITRYLGIRQFKNNQWYYGYLTTKKQAASYSVPLYIIATALQGVATATAKPQLAGIEAYPNPMQSVLQVKSMQTVRLRIYNAVGSMQHEELLSAGTVAISVASWAPGIYLLRLENEQGIFISRFQKSN